MGDVPVTATMPIIWWRPETYARLIEISTDRDNLFRNFAEWQEVNEARFAQLQDAGFPVAKVLVDPEELLAWAKAQGRAVDGKARAEFVMLVHQRENRNQN